MSELDKETLAKGLQILTDQQTIINNTQREHARTLETHQAALQELARWINNTVGCVPDLSERLTNLESAVNQRVVPQVVEAVGILERRIAELENHDGITRQMTPQITEAINRLTARITLLEASHAGTPVTMTQEPDWSAEAVPATPQITAEGETTVNSTINTTFDPARVTLAELLAMSPQLATGLIRLAGGGGTRNPEIEEAVQVRAGNQLASQAAPVTVTETQPSLAQMYIAQQGLNGIGLSRSDYELAAYGNTVAPIVGARSGRLSNQQVNDLLGVMERAGVIDAARNVATVPNTPLAQPDDRKIEPNL